MYLLSYQQNLRPTKFPNYPHACLESFLWAFVIVILILKLEGSNGHKGIYNIHRLGSLVKITKIIIRLDTKHKLK